MLRAAALFFALASALIAREFDPRRDAFAFPNDTVFNYNVDADGRLHAKGRKTKPAGPTHACFLFTRSAIQFWKFARFEPRQPRLSEEEYREKIRALFRTAPWAERSERIVFPATRTCGHFRGLMKKSSVPIWEAGCSRTCASATGG